MQQPQDKIRKTGQVIFSVLAMGLPLIKSDVTFLLLLFYDKSRRRDKELSNDRQKHACS
jgi:hypothetical protein|tara:strand:- start:270 stop:446 length:177 start_codon:yes stop_codon:yes gene_type:complete